MAVIALSALVIAIAAAAVVVRLTRVVDELGKLRDEFVDANDAHQRAAKDVVVALTELADVFRDRAQDAEGRVAR